jgi:hypothetical protein
VISDRRSAAAVLSGQRLEINGGGYYRLTVIYPYIPLRGRGRGGAVDLDLYLKPLFITRFENRLKRIKSQAKGRIKENFKKIKLFFKRY